MMCNVLVCWWLRHHFLVRVWSRESYLNELEMAGNDRTFGINVYCCVSYRHQDMKVRWFLHKKVVCRVALFVSLHSVAW